jgi:hypothetical protein
MSQKQSHPESRGKGGADGGKPLTKAEAKKAMARFESLTRRLLTVSRAQLQKEQERHEERKRQASKGLFDCSSISACV